jgi:hypothetical protein
MKENAIPDHICKKKAKAPGNRETGSGFLAEHFRTVYSHDIKNQGGNNEENGNSPYKCRPGITP